MQTQTANVPPLGGTYSPAPIPRAKIRASKLGYISFVALTGVLLIRPSDLFNSSFPLYMIVLGFTLVLAVPGILHRISLRAIATQPISKCVIGILFAIFISHLTKLNFGQAVDGFLTFFKVVIFYLLVVGVLDSEDRIENFAKWLLFYICVVAALAILQFYQYIDIAEIRPYVERQWDPATGLLMKIFRIKGPGVFNDPNDLSLISCLGVALVFYLRNTSKDRLRQLILLFCLSVLLTAIFLTKSRGGFLALTSGSLAYISSRYSMRRAVILALICGPLFLLFFSGRQARIDVKDTNDTAHLRIEAWSNGLDELVHSPIFGIGYDQFIEDMGMVAHNSFVHAFVELGVFGGSYFFGIYYITYFMLAELKKKKIIMGDVRLRWFAHFLLFALISNAAGIFSLSRNFVTPTYIIPGLATSYFMLLDEKLGKRTWIRIGFVGLMIRGAICLFFLKVFVYFLNFH